MNIVTPKVLLNGELVFIYTSSFDRVPVPTYVLLCSGSIQGVSFVCRDKGRIIVDMSYLSINTYFSTFLGVSRHNLVDTNFMLSSFSL